jgi:hypothetical protein
MLMSGFGLLLTSRGTRSRRGIVASRTSCHDEVSTAAVGQAGADAKSLWRDDAERQAIRLKVPTATRESRITVFVLSEREGRTVRYFRFERRRAAWKLSGPLIEYTESMTSS